MTSKKSSPRHAHSTRGRRPAGTVVAGTLLRARDLMERHVTTIGPELDAHEVARVLAEGHMGGVPVVGDGGELLGVISKTDLSRAVAEEKDEAILEGETDRIRSGPLPSVGEDEDEIDLEPRIAARPTIALQARDLMSENVVTADEDETAGELAARMLEHGIHRVIVLRRRTVVGIVSSTDLLRAVAEYEACLAPRA